VEWQKREWRSRGLLKHIQLTISCCPGRATLLMSSGSPVPRMNLAWEHQPLPTVFQPSGWAEQSEVAEEALLPLPLIFEELRFDPFIWRAESNANSGIWIAVRLAENTLL
jgi:hypothetical protein